MQRDCTLTTLWSHTASAIVPLVNIRFKLTVEPFFSSRYSTVLVEVVKLEELEEVEERAKTI
jgi:hypothetical protein